MTGQRPDKPGRITPGQGTSGSDTINPSRFPTREQRQSMHRRGWCAASFGAQWSGSTCWTIRARMAIAPYGQHLWNWCPCDPAILSQSGTTLLLKSYRSRSSVAVGTPTTTYQQTCTRASWLRHHAARISTPLFGTATSRTGCVAGADKPGRSRPHRPHWLACKNDIRGGALPVVP